MKEDDELKIHRKSQLSTGLAASNETANEINTSIGRPLDESIKSFMGPRFGYNFSDVQIHDDSQANQLTDSVNARAFTVGNNIFLGRNESTSDKELMAHELTHVIQQGNTKSAQFISRSDVSIQRQNKPSQKTTTFYDKTNSADLIKKIDKTIRKKYGIKTTSPVNKIKIMDEKDFQKSFGKKNLGQLLFELFRYDTSTLADDVSLIKRQNGFTNMTSDKRIRKFVKSFLKDNYLDFYIGTKLVRVTPRELVSQTIAGHTTMEKNPYQRKIYLRAPFRLRTIIHEIMHFYAHPNFLKFIASLPNEGGLKIGKGIQHNLKEGLAEVFTAFILYENSDKYGKFVNEFYADEFYEVARLVNPLGWYRMEKAYFHGDKEFLKIFKSFLLQYKDKKYPDIIPLGAKAQ